MSVYTVSEVAMMGRYPHLGPFEIEGPADLAIPRGERSLAEAEGMGAWEDRHDQPVGTGKQKKALTLDERRAAARALRKPREWEKP